MFGILLSLVAVGVAWRIINFRATAGHRANGVVQFGSHTINSPLHSNRKSMNAIFFGKGVGNVNT